MGRIKRGLDYFPMSTSFMHDRMVRRIMRREGDSAFATLVETLSYIYAGKGYYISVGDEFYEELVDSLYSTELDDVKRIISLSVEYGLFDAGLFRQYNILTSADIQRQFLFITKRRSRRHILRPLIMDKGREGQIIPQGFGVDRHALGIRLL